MLLWLTFITAFAPSCLLPPSAKVLRYVSLDRAARLTLRSHSARIHGHSFTAFTVRLRSSVQSDRPLSFPFNYLRSTDSLVYVYDPLYTGAPSALGKGVQVLFDFHRTDPWLLRLPAEAATVEIRRDHVYYSSRYADSVYVFTCRPQGFRAVPWLPVVCRVSRQHGLVGLTMASVRYPFVTSVMDADDEDITPERTGPMWEGREAEAYRISFRLIVPQKESHGNGR